MLIPDNSRLFSLSPLSPHVIHVLYSGLGGHSAVLFSLLEAGFMRTARHSIVFAGVEPPPFEYVRRCEDLQVSWDYFSKLSGKQNLRFLWGFKRKIAALNPDVLFLHGLSAIPAVALLKIFTLKKQPYVLLRETQANDLKSRREWITLAIAHRFADRIVHLTEDAAEGAALRLWRVASPEKVAIVPNGLDTSFYIPAPAERKVDECFHIGMQSRLQPNKDHPTLIRAFALLREQHPDKQFHLHIAGEGSTYKAIEELIKKYHLVHHTTLHGMLGRDALRDFLHKLDIYVHATHGETMSTAIMQALSCGLPVIASDVSGVNNMVRPEAGLLYRPGDVADLAKKLEGLIRDPMAAETWRKLARNYAVKNYAISATVKSYEALIP